MRKGWRTVPLQSLCDDFRQDIVDGPFGSELQRKDYVGAGVPVLKIQNVHPFEIELKKMDYVSERKFAELRRHSFRRGDIVMTKLGKPLGVSAVVDDIDDGVIVADLVRIRAQQIDARYLCYHLNSSATSEYINSMQKGTTRPRVTLSVVRQLPIAVPSPTEQRRIVAILDEAFEGIAIAKANAETNLKNAGALFNGHLRAIFADGGPNWTHATVDQHIRFIDYRGRTPEKTAEGLRLITAKNIKKGFIQDEPMEFVAPESYASWMTRGIPNVGDVLFTTEAPLGNVAQLHTEDRVVFAQRVIIMQTDPKVLDSTFLKYMLLSAPLQARIHAQATGATAQGIKASLLKRIGIAFPQSLSKQEAIVNTLDALTAESNRLERLYAGKLALLDELKRALLARAFNGEL